MGYSRLVGTGMAAYPLLPACYGVLAATACVGAETRGRGFRLVRCPSTSASPLDTCARSHSACSGVYQLVSRIPCLKRVGVDDTAAFGLSKIYDMVARRAQRGALWRFAACRFSAALNVVNVFRRHRAAAAGFGCTRVTRRFGVAGRVPGASAATPFTPTSHLAQVTSSRYAAVLRDGPAFCRGSTHAWTFCCSLGVW
jgi:hypothetical protein